MEEPEQIGKYRILSLLGQGAMGRVFLAEDPMIDRRVAIKMMSTEGDVEAQERFRQEARTIGQLSHPNIVHLYDFGVHQGSPYLVMEYLEGESLDRWLKRRPPMEARLSVLLDLCRAIAYSHSREVLHRDIKPSNLQVLPDGSCKLLDFGIARGRSAGLTATGTVLGTPQFMAPEVLKDAGYSKRSDMYAVALTAYEILTGSNPFGADTLEGCLTRVLTYEPPELGELLPRVPAEVSETFGAYLEKDPALRPADLARLEGALERLRAHIAAESTLEVAATQPLPRAEELAGTSSDEFPTVRAEQLPTTHLGTPRSWAGPAALAVVIALGLLAVWAPWRSGGAPEPEPVVQAPVPAEGEASAPAQEVGEAEEDSPDPLGSAAASSPAATASMPPEKSIPPPQSPAEGGEARDAVETNDIPEALEDPQEASALLSSEEPASQAQQTPPPDPSPPVETDPIPTRKPPVEEPPAENQDFGAPPEPIPSEPDPVAPPVSVEAPAQPAPHIEQIVPRTLRRGAPAVLTITGSDLGPDVEIVIRRGTQRDDGFRLRRRKNEGDTRIEVTLFVGQQVPIGLYSVVIVAADGRESRPFNLEVSL